MNPDRIVTPFGWDTTADQVIDGIDLTGKRAIVTGAASGIGEETARALASAGADVTIAVRNLEAGHLVADRIIESAGNSRVRVAEVDLADQDSIAAFVAAWSGPLDILVDNAGIMASPELRTREGWELQFATNHLGHFALTNGLHSALAAAVHARVVVVSSVGHINGDVIWDDINFEHHPYEPWAAYSQSKTANILFAVEAAKRWAKDGISVDALMPGRIATNLTRFMEQTPAAPDSFQANNAQLGCKTIAQGAATSVLLAASPLVEGVTGRYFEDGNEAEAEVPGVRKGVAPYALDEVNAARLWQISVDMLAAGGRA